MHAATRAAIVGMLGMIRQACAAIEFSMVNDEPAIPGRDPAETVPDAERYLSEKEEAMVGAMLGLDGEAQ